VQRFCSGIGYPGSDAARRCGQSKARNPGAAEETSSESEILRQPQEGMVTVVKHTDLILEGKEKEES
jgi:hypothetical protein